MTLVLNNRYGFDRTGLKAYFINRWLRIYPTYYLIAFFTALTVLLTKSEISGFHAAVRMPSDLIEWIGNILIIPFILSDEIRLVPPTWSIAVELFYYAMIPFTIGRNRIAAGLGLAIGVIYTLAAISMGLDFKWRYYNVLGALAPFSMGAMLYFYREMQLIGNLVRYLPIIVAAFVFNAILAATIYSDPLMLPFYISLVLSFLLVASVNKIKIDSEPIRNADAMIGKMSYPMFLSHWWIGYLVKAMFHLEANRSLKLFLLSWIIVILFSFLVVKFVDENVESVRDRIRRGVSFARPASDVQ